MRRRWYIVAVLAGALAAAVVWAWPVSPRWRSGPDVGRLEGFSSDGQVLITCRVPPPADGIFPNPEVFRWDAATGELLSRVEMPCTDPFRAKEVRPSADGRTVLVGEGVPPNGRLNGEYRGGDWYLHDGFTGNRTAGPIPGVALVGPMTFSPDGRWFVGIHGRSHGEIGGIRGRDFFSAATGELVLGLPDHDGLLAVGCFFAPDGETVAVDWIPNNLKNNTQHTIQVFELPSGRQRYRFELPPRDWQRIKKWDGRRLEAIERVWDGNFFQLQSCLFDLLQQPVGDGFEDPLLGTAGSGAHIWVDGPDWVAYFTTPPPSGLPPQVLLWADWLAARIGIRSASADKVKVKVRIVNRATEATRCQPFMPPRGTQKP